MTASAKALTAQQSHLLNRLIDLRVRARQLDAEAGDLLMMLQNPSYSAWLAGLRDADRELRIRTARRLLGEMGLEMLGAAA